MERLVSVDWKAGHQIVVAPTEWYGNVLVTQSVHDANMATQRLTLASSSANIVQTTSCIKPLSLGFAVVHDRLWHQPDQRRF